jgi:hypothetical protein
MSFTGSSSTESRNAPGMGEMRLADGDGYVEQEEHTTETRRSIVTSEFWLFLILSVALLFFAYESGGDSFSRDDGWRYVSWLAIGYFVSRGLSKAGAYETYLRGRDH